MSNTKTPPITSFYKRAFSLVELIIVVAIIGILSGTAYLGIQRGKFKMYNDKVLDDIIGIANALEQYNHDHWGVYPIPEVDGNMNISCFYADATYAHDCDTSAFRQGMIDNNLLTRRYMPEVPTDPRTGSRYVYGVSNDGKYYMVGGIFEESNGNFTARTSGNMKKGYHLPSLIRAFNGPNFVVNYGGNLPYSPDHLIISARLENMNGTVTVNGNPASNGTIVYSEDIINTDSPGTVDIYFSDGSFSSLSENSTLEILNTTEVAENDKDNIITRIKLRLTNGKIWNKVARLASASEFNIETSSAIAGVRGTEFGVDVNDDILLYSGSICSDGTKICIDPIVVAPGDDPITVDLNDSSTPITNTGLTTLMNEQTKHYLNDNIRPHIKSVEGLTVTFENLNSYYDLPEDIYLEVSKLVSSDSADITITPSNTDDYTFIFSSAPSNPVTFYYEDNNGRKSGNSIPITISSETNLSGEDLYGIPESIEWVDPYEEVIICDDTTMMIGSDLLFDGDLNATVMWSVTPPECFEEEVFNVYFGEGSTPTSSHNTAVIDGNNYLITAPSTPGTEYFWKVEVDGMTTVFDNNSEIAPIEPTWCGDGTRDVGEQCEYNASSEPGIGCIMIGADQCTCNVDLGYKPDTTTTNVDCVCDDTLDKEITLTTLESPETIPINSSLTWEVSPACAFEEASYVVQIAETDITGVTSTSLSLVGLTDFSPTPGNTYDWIIQALDASTLIATSLTGSFEVECSEVPDYIVLINPTNHYNTTIAALQTSQDFTWDPSTPECLFDNVSPEPYLISVYKDTTLICDKVEGKVTGELPTACVDLIEDAGVGDFTWKVERQTTIASVIATNDPSPSAPKRGEFKVSAPANTFAITPPVKTYYEVNENIQFNVDGYDSVGVSGGDWTHSSSIFTSTVAGTYELTPMDGTTPGTAVPIIVCGYVGDSDTPMDYSDDECWIAGEPSTDAIAGESCTDACSSIGLTCNTDPNWNDCGPDGDCGTSVPEGDDGTACLTLMSSTSPVLGTDFATANYAPYWFDSSSITKCTPRNTTTTNCTAETDFIPSLSFRRICSCVQ